MSGEERALQRAEDYVRDRGWRQEPLTWEEVADLLDALDRADEDYVHRENLAIVIAGVAMSKTARRALAKALDLDEAEVTPRPAVA